MEKVTVAQLLPQLENTEFHIDEQPYSSLFKIYKNEFLDVSVFKGLIDTSSLALAGDGTPVVTYHLVIARSGKRNTMHEHLQNVPINVRN